uniref:Uncharacterized protein n=1 Tax=Strix occidentalis caurina TaxID=311401 RepID=A0A8D0F8T2_STROC
MERGIQYLRELAMQEMVCYDPDNAQLPTDPDEVQCTQPMWRKFVRSTPSPYANALAVMDWRDKEGPTVDELACRLRQYEENLSSPLVAAVEKLSQEFQKFKENLSYSPPARTRILAIRSSCFSTRENRQRQPSGTPRLILPMHFSPSLWQQNAGHSLLLPGGVSNTPGNDCPRVETQPQHLPWTDPDCTGTG